ncbi:hypothetical protein NC796_17045 [Aliifodinibius sp. S!AR15-10]|uniref:TRADD-N-associated membrane domain-containing protein n=1 Tax=Aliifodinibius sp. S!AR15-10 TaxID=2950437 RepID=UPI002854D2D0|nr:hypothetical protein [Aliifodinibius sp. S!AR15-10]MDR8392866.1 hypothetical protein [Aliifodinibius sp. S!AR15-10]
MIDQKKRKKNIEGPKFSWKVWGMWVTVITIIASVSLILENPFNVSGIFIYTYGIGLGLLMGIFVATFYYGAYHFTRWIQFKNISKPIIEQISLQNEAEKLQNELEDNFFTNLVKINFKYLDKYYLQTQVQANKSFILSAVAAILGFIIIITGIVLMFLDKTNPAYVTTGAGLLSEFIAAVFFYLYNKTIIKMGDYHQKLVITQNISLALKISESLPEDNQSKAQLEIIRALTDGVNMYLTNTPSNFKENQLGMMPDKPKWDDSKQSSD